MKRFQRYIVFALVILMTGSAHAQFYQGMNEHFGKNRVQYDEFIWQYYPYDRFRVYFNTGGKESAALVADYAEQILADLETEFDFYFDDSERINFVVYNKLEHFRQSNIGLLTADDNNIGGVTQIQGANVFLYMTGKQSDLQKQIRRGIAQIIIRQIMFGSNWREVAKNSALLSIPTWFMDGLVDYSTEAWNPEIENFVYQAAESKKFSKFSHLYGDYPVEAGHILWNYVGQTYGRDVIPNILYMTRISRNIESGFLFILGESLRSIIEDSESYYMQRYSGPYDLSATGGTALEKRWKKSREYTQFEMSPDRKWAAYSTIELGQKKIYIVNLENDKKKCIFKKDPKLERINDDGYPLLHWHPRGEHLSFVWEKQGEILYSLYELSSGDQVDRPMFTIEKVLSYDFSTDGKQLIISGLKQGQSDIYVYSIGPKTLEQITDDIYDDLDPAFSSDNDFVFFASNRFSDTLNASINYPLESLDLFSFNYQQRKSALLRITDGPSSEFQPQPLDSGRFMYLSAHTGLNQRYLGQFDSVLSHVDTALHFRYITETELISDYRRNIVAQSFDPKTRSLDEIVSTTGFHPLRISQPYHPNAGLRTPTIDTTKGFVSQQKPWISEFRFDPPPVTDIITNYRFNSEIATDSIAESKTDESVNLPPAVNKEAIKHKAGLGLSSGRKKAPNIRNYLVAYTTSDIIGQFDFNFANQLYQPFNGGPYVAPGMGTVSKIILKDLFENHVIEGGVRYSFNNSNMEYFLSYENLEKRLDRKIGFQRQTISSVQIFNISKTTIHQGTYRLKWSFNEVSSLSGTFVGRLDNTVLLSTDRNSLQAPNLPSGWTGMKLEYVYDNTREAGLNLRYGFRMKGWAEHYREVTNDWVDFSVIGLDARHYQKVYKNMIFATRFAASSSFGTRKLVYYLGAIDNWAVLGNRQKFNFETNIDNDKGYFYQTLATPIRGFQQNIRNGNNFAIVNAEFRIPIVQMLFMNPVRSDFLNNLQLTAFGDIGSAWTGSNPYSEDNTFNSRTIVSGPLTIRIKNMQDPIVGSYGFGLRSRLWGYFAKLDYAWTVEDRAIKDPSIFLSLGLDF